MPFAFFIIYHYCNQDFPLHPEETQTPNPTGPVRPGFPTDNNLCVPACLRACACFSLPIRDFFSTEQVSQGRQHSLLQQVPRAGEVKLDSLGQFWFHFKEMR